MLNINDVAIKAILFFTKVVPELNHRTVPGMGCYKLVFEDVEYVLDD